MRHRASGLTERNRPHCTDPTAHLGVVLLIHVKEMGHRGMHRRPRLVVGRHIHDAAEHFQEAGIPVFGDVMQRGEAGIDEGLQIGADRFARVRTTASPGVRYTEEMALASPSSDDPAHRRDRLDD